MEIKKKKNAINSPKMSQSREVVEEEDSPMRGPFFFV